MKRSGFSLVELSIVLVILGLLVGGILAGQSLIRAAELRAVSTEFQRYSTATYAFRDKYFAMPGDFNAATRFWGRLNSNSDCATNSSAAVTTPGACDGNGDGTLTYAAASQSAEVMQFWRQLTLAGFIEGNYTGIAGSGGVNDSTIGTNVPSSKLAGAGWSAITTNYYAGDGNSFQNDYGNNLQFGGARAGNSTRAAILKPEEAWNIDTKLDDGKPATGKVTVFYWPNCTTAASFTDYSSTYKLTDSTLQCSMNFMRSF